MNAKLSRSVRPLVVASSIAVLLGLAACGKQDDSRTVGQQVDSAVNKTEQAAREAKQDTQAAMNSAGSTIKDAAQDVQQSAQNAGAAISEKVADTTITASVSAGLAKDPELSAIKIDVDTKDGVVKLSGPAPSMSARERASEIAKAVKGVASVDNQLQVKMG